MERARLGRRAVTSAQGFANVNAASGGRFMMRRSWVWGVSFLIACSLPSGGHAAESAPASNVEPALQKLANELADQSQPLAHRLEIVRAFAGWGTPQVRAPLVATLKDPAPELREAAAQALAWPGNREAIAPLRERFDAQSETLTVKAAAIGSLGVIGDPSVRPLLVAASQHPDAGVRQGALWGLALGPLVDPADRTSYLIRLAGDRALDGLFRCDAIRALVAVNEDRVVDALMRILESEPRLTIALPEGKPTEAQLMDLRRVQSRDVSAWAAGALGELRSKRAVPLLLKTADDPRDLFLRLMSVQALIILEASEARPVFIGRLEDPVADIRMAALVGLRKVGDRSAIAPVLARLSDESPEVRAQAVMTVASLGDATVRPPLEALQRTETASNVLSVLDDALATLPR